VIDMMRRRFLAGSMAASIALLAMAALPTGAAPPAQEQSRIEKLIRYVESQKAMKFIRNGSEYTSEDAGKFLRGKLEAMGSEVTTARQFIKRIASRSSMSGQPYHVRLADGQMLLAENFLEEELQRIERQPG
jgi:uncharacterized protein DUF5329